MITESKKKLRILFAGTSNVAANILNTIIKNYKIIGIITKPDKISKNNKSIISPVKSNFISKNLTILQPIKIKNNIHLEEEITKLKPDIILVVAYGLILSENILLIPNHGCINIHFSLLPRWRGAAPVQRAIEMGDQTTGISIIKMNKNLDEGDILYQVKTKICSDDNTEILTNKLEKIAIYAINIVIKKIEENKSIKYQKQSGNVTYASKVNKKDATINWDLSAKIIDQKIRAFGKWPGIRIIIDNIKVKVLKSSIIKSSNRNNINNFIGMVIEVNKTGISIQSKTEIIKIEELQFPGKKQLHVKKLINGYDLKSLVGKKVYFA